MARGDNQRGPLLWRALPAKCVARVHSAACAHRVACVAAGVAGAQPAALLPLHPRGDREPLHGTAAVQVPPAGRAAQMVPVRVLRRVRPALLLPHPAAAPRVPQLGSHSESASCRAEATRDDAAPAPLRELKRPPPVGRRRKQRQLSHSHADRSGEHIHPVRVPDRSAVHHSAGVQPVRLGGQLPRALGGGDGRRSLHAAHSPQLVHQLLPLCAHRKQVPHAAARAALRALPSQEARRIRQHALQPLDVLLAAIAVSHRQRSLLL